MTNEDKLDWIYKGANSLVDREEYLLGRKVDKTLDQINDEEKVKKIVLPKPKNHVEHECIPPSIRDFNKIVQGEQVDLSAKLQEDPLVAIKKREEEARRQFLQNPVQLKKLQEALHKKQLKKHKKKNSERDLDRKLREKLKKLKSSNGGGNQHKKEQDEALNTILMHKFNALKSKLSDDDLQDILNGKVSSDEELINSKRKKSKKTTTESPVELDKKIMAQLKLLRTEAEEKQKKKVMLPAKPASSSTSTSDSDSDRDDNQPKRNYGLVTSEGQKIAFKSTYKETKTNTTRKQTASVNVDKKRVQKLSAKEKERRLKEMMADAKIRDKERHQHLKAHNESHERDASAFTNQKYDADLIHTQLMKMAKSTTIEDRIKSNLNNIQRSSHAMNRNFSKK